MGREVEWGGEGRQEYRIFMMERGEEVHDSDDSVSDFGDEERLDNDSVL